MEEKQSIKMWAEADRPREKLLERGVKALTDAELLAILLGSGNDRQNAVELAQEILADSQEDLDRLASKSVKELQTQYRGVGAAKAVTIVAAMELMKRRRFAAPKAQKISGAKEASLHIAPHLCGLDHEEFWVMLLSQAHQVLDLCCVSKGGIAQTQVDLRLLFHPAITQKASAIILFHNHPSGQLSPSQDDIALTERIQKAGKILDIRVLDHLICHNDSYYSFAENGLL